MNIKPKHLIYAFAAMLILSLISEHCRNEQKRTSPEIELIQR